MSPQLAWGAAGQLSVAAAWWRVRLQFQHSAHAQHTLYHVIYFLKGAGAHQVAEGRSSKGHPAHGQLARTGVLLTPPYLLCC